MKKGKIIAIIIPSVLLLGGGIFLLVSFLKNKDASKVNESQWKENFSAIFNYENRNFQLSTQLPHEHNKILNVINGKETFNENNDSQDQYKYFKNHKAYKWDSANWTTSENEIMFSEDQTKCGLHYIKGIENSFANFTYNDSKYTGRFNDMEMEICFKKSKTLDTVEFIPSGATEKCYLMFSFNEANLGDFPNVEPQMF